MNGFTDYMILSSGKKIFSIFVNLGSIVELSPLRKPIKAAPDIDLVNIVMVASRLTDEII